MAKAEKKTNVMRILDQEKIPYTEHTYEVEDGLMEIVMCLLFPLLKNLI